MGTHEHPTGYYQLWNIPRLVAKFRENRLRDVEKSAACYWKKQNQHEYNVTVFCYRFSDTRATVKSKNVIRILIWYSNIRFQPYSRAFPLTACCYANKRGQPANARTPEQHAKKQLIHRRMVAGGSTGKSFHGRYRHRGIYGRIPGNVHGLR